MLLVAAGFFFWLVVLGAGGLSLRGVRPGRAEAWPLGVLGLASAGALAFALNPHHNFTFVVDDAYYYLQVAIHTAVDGTPSFDGLHATNGWNPLWLCMLAALYKVAPVSKAAFVCVAQVAGIVLMTVSGLILYRLAARVLRPLAVAAVLVVWVHPWAFLRFWLGGMETPAFYVLFLSLLWVWHSGLQTRHPSHGRQVGAGLLAGLLLLARPDAAVLVAAAALTVPAARGLPGRARIRPAAAFLGMAAVPMLLYTVWNLVEFGHPGSVSSHLKLFVWTAPWTERLLMLCTPLRSWRVLVPAWVLCVVTPVFLGGGLLAAWRLVGRCRQPVARLAWLVIWVGVLHYVVVSLAVTHSFSWYFPVENLGLAFGVGFAVERLAVVASRWAPWVARMGVLLMAAGSFALTVHGTGERPRFFVSRELGRLARSGAEWVNRNSAPGAVVASWDAGLFGYFCERPVIPLDGLVNAWEYVEVMRSGRYVEYARREGIDYVANYMYRVDDGLVLARPGLEQLRPHLVEVHRTAVGRRLGFDVVVAVYRFGK